jgi:D-alanyl-D-alanine carboxypeptidase/D-alanyl-D-alanine-endopeptidase (penicillin-binding protein 4)
VEVVLQGRFPPGCRAEADLNMVDRQWVLERSVRRLWRELGGRWSGRVLDGPAPTQATVRASHEGRPLAELLRPLLKESDNPLARLLFQSIGASMAAPGEPTLEAAARDVQGWLGARGIPTAGLVLDNGSGLSRLERVQPQQLALLLQQVLKGPHGADLLAALPVAGVDGTLGDRLGKGPAAGRARLKTGTLSEASALAGLVPDAAGRAWVLVGFVNHPGAGVGGRAVLDALVEWVAARAD